MRWQHRLPLGVFAALSIIPTVTLQVATTSTHGAAAASTYDVFASFLAPITPEAFFDATFETATMHSRRNQTTFFSHSSPASMNAELPQSARDQSKADLRFDLAELWMVLDTTGSAFEPAGTENMRVTLADLRLVKRVLAADNEYWSAVYPLSRIPATTPLDSRFARWALDQGFTLVLNRLNYRYAPIADLCSRLTRDLFGWRIQANLYLTPTNSSGFEAHFDWQESFVLQLSGEKRWTVLDDPLIALPRADQKFKPRLAQMTQTRRMHLLAPGSMLYFPSGVIHEATTTAGEVGGTSLGGVLPASMHLTLGVEIDPLFTMQGLLHLFLDHTSRAKASLRAQLLQTIPAASCDGVADSQLTYLDLLQWSVFDAASRTNESDSFVPKAHRFRRSLWGLHRWSEPALRRALTTSPTQILIPPSTRSLAALLLAPDAQTPPEASSEWNALDADARHALAFHLHAARRLLPLLNAMERSEFSLVDSLPSLHQLQARIRSQTDTDAADTADSPFGEFTKSSQPSQAKYEFESFFDDPILTPFIQPAIDDTAITAMLHTRGSDAACTAAYLAEVQSRLRALWRQLMVHADIAAWQHFLDVARTTGPDSVDPASASTRSPSPVSWPRSFDLLTSPLSLIHNTLVASQSSHLAVQSRHVAENTRRQQAFLAGRRALHANHLKQLKDEL